ncbi:hypothetical protein A6U86_10670 [Rhizobium sp. AC27/96]|uniref:hypothetical protein n=1 Tax=Rhizobium TaxID=379 RepID=UPI0008274C55|nr:MULTISPECIES: hypothetical protein [Rhizobium]NTF45152.1 hypothetical protein [Rhizobium rhizogenes]OCJ07499.1 hypothetical protein A6U86_10670 [Rhizobium sp. AC27/96]
MTEQVAGPMSAERFAELADAYGGDIGRWPQPERAAAREYAENSDLDGALRRAADLDALLDTYVLKTAHQDLGARIATKLARRSKIRNWFRFGSAGVGLVGIGIAGALAGSVAIAVLAPSLTSETTMASDGTSTMFGDIGPDVTITQESQ